MGVISCVVMTLLFLVMALVFTLLKEKGAMLISGFNTLSREERAQYDQLKMSLDMRDDCLTWAGIWAVGAVMSYVVGPWLVLVALVVWLTMFFKKVHWDSDKAFEAYKKKPQ